MKRLTIEVQKHHDILKKTLCSPYNFAELFMEKRHCLAETARRHQQLSLRFSHQLERLRLAETSISPSSHSRHAVNALKTLSLMHIDACEKLHYCQSFLDRMETSHDIAINKGGVSDGEKMSLIYEEIEARHACAIETVMEAMQGSVLPSQLLYPFFSTRMSIQLLLLHHLHKWQHKGFENAEAVSSSSALSILNNAITECTYTCEAHYDLSPQVNVEHSEKDEELQFIQCSSYVKYILLELLKNAMRATIEKHIGFDEQETTLENPSGQTLALDEDDLDVITVRFRLFEEDVLEENRTIEMVAIDIIDKGNGISQETIQSSLSKLGRIRRQIDTSNNEIVGESMSDKLWSRLDDQVSYMPARSPLHGIGVGLAMSDAYAHYIGGELTIESVQREGNNAARHEIGTSDGISETEKADVLGGGGTMVTLKFPRIPKLSNGFSSDEVKLTSPYFERIPIEINTFKR